MNARSPHTPLGEVITLAHGSGGKAMSDLIEQLFIGAFGSPQPCLEDQARFTLDSLGSLGDRLALTTDSFVVDPPFFPGGDIGKLAVAGTVNDLAVGGATPLYLTCALILEEGLPIRRLRRIIESMRQCADEAGVQIVTGDTKVVPRGAADGLFINTAGIGVIRQDCDIRSDRARPGDCILVNGYIGDHGAAIVDARGELRLDSPVESDCQPLNGLVGALLDGGIDIHCLRDATRGGLATVLNEFAGASGVAMRIEEPRIPLRDSVRGVCEILGLDPLYLANEGKLVAIVPPQQAEQALALMRAHPAGRDAAVIGEVQTSPGGRVLLATGFGGERIVDRLVGEQLPRIC